MRFVPGETFGRYRVEAELGRGGQAVVYRATQLDLDRQVALKIFDEGYLTRAGALERFRREAIAAGRLEHPRIVPVHDAGEIEGRAYIAMRLIPGDTLASRIARGGPLAADEALDVLGDIAEALDFAHARGTIHRDVKPANILLDPRGAAYLSDFGLVRLDDMPGLTRRGDWLGTAEYVSPEQVEGEPATARSDVYALGAVAFEALTGRPPFVRREASAVLLAHVRDEPPRASALHPGLPPSADAPLASALAKRPDERPRSARALVDELRHALGSPNQRPTLVGAPAPAAGDPWDAALARFAGEGEDPRPTAAHDRPTRALGAALTAARRRPSRRTAAAAAAVVLTLAGIGAGGWALGQAQADVEGAEAAGLAEGRRAGLALGVERGREAGLAEGRKIGRTAGVRQGRKTGFEQGRKEGYAAGESDGYARGVADGRAGALEGLSPGAWYIVRVGEDGSGPVIERPQQIVTDEGECYTVSGGTIFSGEC